MDFQDVPLFTISYNVFLLIIPLTAFAFIFVFLAHSLKSRKEILICRISQKIREKQLNTTDADRNKDLQAYMEFLSNPDNIKKLRVRDLERIEEHHDLIRLFAKKYNIKKDFPQRENDACGITYEKREPKKTT